MDGEIFITGATGFIGGSILQKWLNGTDLKVNLLVRSKKGVNPKSRTYEVLTGLFPETDISAFSQRVEVIEGDLDLERFGLEEIAYKQLARRTTHILHCGAAVRFDLEISQARHINVQGTERVLAFARTCPQLERVSYVGTAYVAGKQSAIVRDDDLDKGQEHKNTYERSKFEAEKLVRAAMPELPITIFRPSIVVCDSRTGRLSRHSAFNRALRRYALGSLTMLPGNLPTRMDLVPVDFVADAAFAIVKNPTTIGRCYHLTAGLDNLTSLGEIRDLASQHFGRKKFIIVRPTLFYVNMAILRPFLAEKVRKGIEELKLYTPYLVNESLFDNSNTVKESGMKVPPFRSYFGVMAKNIQRQLAIEAGF